MAEGSFVMADLIPTRQDSGKESQMDTEWDILTAPPMPMEANIFQADEFAYPQPSNQDSSVPIGIDGHLSPSFISAESMTVHDQSTYTPPSIGDAPVQPKAESTVSPATCVPIKSPSMETNQVNAALKEWEKNHEKELEKKRQEEEKFVQNKRKEAQAAIDQWYKDREAQVQQVMVENRAKEALENEQRRLNQDALASNPKTSWDRVLSLIEFTAADGRVSNQAPSAKLVMKQKSTGHGECKGHGHSSASPNNPKQQPLPSFAKDTSRMLKILHELSDSKKSEEMNSGIVTN